MSDNSVDGHYPTSKDLPKIMDGGRELGLFLFIVALVGSAFIQGWDVDGDIRVAAIVFLWVSLFLPGAFVFRWLRRRGTERRAKAAQEYRAMREADVQRQIAEMKARSAAQNSNPPND